MLEIPLAFSLSFSLRVHTAGKILAFRQTSAILSSELQIPKAGKSEAFLLCKTCHAKIFSLLQMALHVNLKHRASRN